MTIRLRAHHLLCVLTYVGKGYTPAFTANYDAIARRLSAGEDVMMVADPDDVCVPLLQSRGAHCRNASVVERDRRAARDVTALIGKPVRAGSTISLDAAILVKMRAAFATGTIRQACQRCEWAALCTSIAGEDFAGVRVQPG